MVDVSNAGSVATLMKDIEKSFSQTPDCAVNCAGITRDAMLLKMTENDFDQVLNVNLKVHFDFATMNKQSPRIFQLQVLYISSWR